MNRPRLGIFWIIDGEVVAFSVTRDRAEHIGGFGNYPHGHAQLWPLVQRGIPALAKVEYDELPRGRVTFDARTQMFNLWMPSALVRQSEVVCRVRSQFDLPELRTLVGADAHYDPPAP